MTFEQPASLNRYILPPIPISWAFRWQLFKLFLPLTFFCALFATQAILLRAWLSDDWGHWLVVRILIGAVLLPAAVMLHLQLDSWLKRKRDKIIKFDGDYVRFGSGLAQRVRWQNIIAWQFNHVANEEKYRVITMKYKWGRKLRRHTIVLEKSQADQLISELKSRRQKDNLDFSISDQDSNFVPKTFEPKKVGAAINYLFFAGTFLLIEGIPFLLVGLGRGDSSPDPDVKPNLNGSFAKFIRKHFSSVAELHHFCLITGAVLCGSGLVLVIWSSVAMKSKTQPIDCY